jgi:hypothetical protein
MLHKTLRVKPVVSLQVFAERNALQRGAAADAFL